jgi:hypothetical protein
MNPVVVGAMINSALYLLCVFVASIVFHVPVAWKSAIASMGFTYLSYLAQMPGADEYLRRGALFLVLVSIVIGAIAGLAQLIAA